MTRLRALDSRPGMAETLATELGPYYDAEVAGVDRALGDVLAWLSSLANQLDLSLDDAMRRYVEDPP